MKFARCCYTKSDTVEFTPRKVAAVHRRLEQARDKVALLPDLVAQVPTPEQDMAKTLAGTAVAAAEWRNRRARSWREARRLLSLLPEHAREGVRRYWDNWCTNGNPADPEFLAGHAAAALKGRCYWSALRFLRQLWLVGQGRLPREMFFRQGGSAEPAYRRRDWRDHDTAHFRRRRARKLGLLPQETQRTLALCVA